MLRYAKVAGIWRHVQGWKKNLSSSGLVLPEPATDAYLAEETDIRPSDLTLFPVFDQKGLGSCVANMGCDQLTLLRIRLGLVLRQFSRLDLYWWLRHYEGTSPTEDSGAQIDSVAKVLAMRGCSWDSTWPYDESKFALQPPPETDTEAALHKATLGYKCGSVRAIRASLTQGFGVGFGFTVFQNVMSDECAATGIVKMPETGEAEVGGHGCMILGSKDSMVIGNSKGAFRFRNHWWMNVDGVMVPWGDAGDGWIPYDYFEKGYATDAETLRHAAVA